MWKRIVIKLAFRYLTRLFMKWMTGQNDETRNSIAECLQNFENYLRKKDSTTTTLVANLIADWKE